MRSVFSVVATLLGWVAGGLLAGPASAQQYPVEHFGSDEGLPQIQVEAMLESDRGYLLVGMRLGGIARFDGHAFTALGTAEESAQQYQLHDLMQDRRGRVWVASASGVLRYDHLGTPSPQTFDETDGLPASEIRTLVETSDGTVWAGTASGLARYEGGSFRAIPALSSKNIYALQPSGDGQLWIGTEQGLYRYGEAGLTQVAGGDHLPAPTVQSLHADSAGTLWVGTSQGAARRVGSRFEVVEATRGQGIQDFAHAGGATWMATYASGLVRFDDGTSTRVTEENGLSTNAPLDLYTDRSGNLWIGSQSGISRLSAAPFRLYTPEQGLPSQLIWNVEGTGGDLWLASQYGLSRFSDGRFVTYGADEGMPPGTAYGLETDRQGRLWVGMRSGTLMRQKSAGVNAEFERVAPEQGGSHPKIFHIEQGPDGDLWLATPEGTWRYDGQRSRRDTLFPNAVTVEIHTDQAGRLWVGTREGVRARRPEGTLLALPDTLRSFPAMSIAEDEAGNLWFSSPQREHIGFYDPDDPDHVRWFGPEDGMLKSQTWFLVFDEAGHLWMGHNTGVSRLDVPHYLRTGETRFEVYSGAEYMGGETVQNAVHRDEQGRLWFAGMEGLVRYDLQAHAHSRTPPISHVTGVVPLYSKANLFQWADSTDATTGLPANLRLPSDQNHLSFQFTSIALTNPAGVQYQYRLKGLNDTWSSAGGRQEASFTNLAPGAYALLVRGRGNDGDWGAPAAYSFSIAPPFWQRWWFYLAAAGGLGVLLAGFIRLRERSLRRQQEHLEAQVADRTRELRAEKERAEHYNGELAQANLELEQLSLVARETENAVVIADAEGRVEWVNDAFTQMTTYTLDELREARGSDLAEAIGKEHVRYIEEIIETAIAQKQSVNYEWSFQTRRGDRKHLFSTLTPVFDEHGALKKLVTVDVDVTEQKHLENQLIEARDQAKDAAQAKSVFLANMSHEIRTPMNGVIGMTSLLNDTSLTPDQREFVDVIRTSGEALLTIINDILDFSKIEAGKIQLEEQPFAVHQVVEDALDLVRPEAAEKSLDLAYYIDAEVPATLRGDVTRLRQILTNLLSNAVKFTEAGEVNVRVNAGASATGEERAVPHKVHFAVEDTGIGIPEDRRESLFGSFSQVDASTTRKYGGTGLGLAISQRLAQLMGGSMDVESTVGEGSTFRFTIRAVAAPPVAGSERLFEEQAALHGARVLVVDGNETNRRMMHLQTERWGMIPQQASSGAEALRLADEAAAEGRAFDAALLDLHLPEMDGLELARRLAEDHPGTARLVLSSAGQRPAPNAEPLDAWLPKPAKAARLLRTLTGVLAEEDAAALGAPPTDEHALERSLAERHPLRILLAEDNAVNQKVALRMLERLGYQADLAANGQEVLDAVERQAYDVVLMDVEMPEMDGLEAARCLRAQYAQGERPCLVAVTANATKEGRAACREAGLENRLTKPFSADALAELLKQCDPLPPSPSHAGAAPPTGAARRKQMADFRLDHLRSLVGDDPAFMDELLVTFLEDTPQRLRNMRAACETADADALEHAAHTLKSSGHTFGADRLVRVCQLLEERGREDRLDGQTAALVTEAEEAFENARSAIAAHRSATC